MRRETFETPGTVTLDLRIPAGRIDVETRSGTKTTVELAVRGNSDRAAELLDDARIELRESGGGHEVVVAVESRGFSRFWQRADVRLTVSAPTDAHLRASTASADLRARGRFGSLDAEAASGDIAVDEVGGDATAKTASGDVNIRSVRGSATVNSASGDAELGRICGPLSVKTASGDARIEDAGADVDVATASGDLRLDAVTSGKVDAKSASGDMRIGIREGSTLWVDARAMSGDLSSEVELGDEPAEAAGDGPHVELHAVSMSGDISVVRAPAPVSH
jgi:Putative adhesin